MTDNFESNDITLCHESDPPQEVSTYLKTTNSVHSTVQGRKKRLSEKAEDYPNVIAELSPDWRIILCRDGIQWILQFHTGGEWRPRSYCRTREGLLRCIRDYIISSIDPNALSIIKRLPDILR